MNGTSLLQLLQSTLGGRILDQTYALQLMNMSRNWVQNKRNWMCMRFADSSQSVPAGNNSGDPVSLATGFMGFLDPGMNGGYGGIQLFNGTQWARLTEVPLEMSNVYRNQFGYFCIDYAQGLLYVLGLCAQPYTVYQFITKDLGDITANSSWSQFPARYAPILPLRSAARWRKGASFDDMNAENAADNDLEVKEMLGDMIKWDTRLQIGASENQDYGSSKHGNGWWWGNGGYGYPYP